MLGLSGSSDLRAKSRNLGASFLESAIEVTDCSAKEKLDSIVDILIVTTR